MSKVVNECWNEAQGEACGSSFLIKKLSEDAKLPTRGSNHAACYYLYSLTEGSIPPGEKLLVRTGISVRMPMLQKPFQIYGSIRSRSGLSVKNDIESGAGVIDYDYDQEICVVLRNHSNKDFSFAKHTRIAQMVLEVHYVADIVEVKAFPELCDQNRMGGFGSTGLN